jgi:DNA-binding winged helix-turn-helix (wHTH) protein
MKNNDVIINRNIVYNKYKSTVHNISDDEFIVTLQNPANQCLAILIEKYPEIVHQDYFFYHVWEKNGLPVNVNTFYQTISLIRKALKSVGLEENIIKTTPRLGLNIPEYVEIAGFAEEELPTKEAISADDESPESDENVALIDPQPAKIEQQTDMSSFRSNAIGLIIFVLAALLSYFFFSSKTKIEHEHLKVSHQYQQCEIHTENSYHALEHIINIVNKFDVKCDKKAVIYYYGMPGIHRDFFFYCSEEGRCTSYNYVDLRGQKR